MSEVHKIVEPPRAEPMSAGRVGVCVRFALSGCPSPRWSRNLAARLTRELTGHSAVGHMTLNNAVQGREIVLEGVESDEAPTLAAAVERAVDAANDASSRDDSANDLDDPTREARQARADDIMSSLRESQRPLPADDEPRGAAPA
jgi:hypothetical protein